LTSGPKTTTFAEGVQRALLEALEQPQEIIGAVFGRTAARILGIQA